MIKLFWCNGSACVWNLKDVMTLREEHRIVGCLIGNYPSRSFQIETKWLPLKLMLEETSLLLNKRIAKICVLSEDPPDPLIIKWFYDQRDRLCEDQILILKENRKLQILEKADEIVEGKKRKLFEALEKKRKALKLSESPIASTPDNLSVQNIDADSKSSHEENSSNLDVCKETIEGDCSRDSVVEGESSVSVSELQDCSSVSMNIDKNAIINAELAKTTNLSKEMCFTQFFTECPWKTNYKDLDWNYAMTSMKELRCAVYKDLWEKKYYITSGVKFGGDFLAYEGDPLKYHALFIIICLGFGQKIQGYDIVTYGRLGHQVKKTVVLASFNNSRQVEYISINWENEMT